MPYEEGIIYKFIKEVGHLLRHYATIKYETKFYEVRY